ncbi:MAG: hypothetical protein RI946_1978, partial [Pseudomonadota bacterium]
MLMFQYKFIYIDGFFPSGRAANKTLF